MARTVTPDGAEIYYVTRGAGPAILFVHGWMSNHRTWDRQIYALQDRYRCVAIDLRGMGQSEKGDWAYSFEEFGSDVRHLIKTLELKDVTLVGRSMGVSVSLSYLERFQDDGDVSRVVLITGPIKLTNAPDWDLGIEEAECMGYIDGVANDPLNGRWRFAEACLLNPSEAEVQSFYQMSLQTPLDVAMKAVRNQLKLDHRNVLKSLRIPCLAVYTGHDFYPPALGEYIAKTAPKGRAVTFEDEGHAMPVQSAEKFNELLIEFIESS